MLNWILSVFQILIALCVRLVYFNANIKDLAKLIKRTNMYKHRNELKKHEKLLENRVNLDHYEMCWPGQGKYLLLGKEKLFLFKGKNGK